LHREPNRPEDARVALDLNEGWSFVKRRASRRWLAGAGADAPEPIALPHCWNEQDTFQPGVRYYRGWGSYRLRFRGPSPEHRKDLIWRLESGGFYGTGDVWLNGTRLARVDGQYLGFCLDPGPCLHAGAENVAAVRLTNRCAKHVLPGHSMPDFLLYGGLAGRLRLAGVPDLHFSRNALRVVCNRIASDEAAGTLRFRLTNASSRDRACRVRWKISGPDGVAAASGENDAGVVRGQSDSAELAVHFRVAAPELWSCRTPALYRAVCRIVEAGVPGDRVTQRFGMRAAEFRGAEGFFLNGQHVPLRGCNRHECMPGFGNALPERMHRADAERIKSMGLNFVRLSHYPQHPAFLNACDELGIAVLAEIATWKSVRTGRWLKAACRQMEALILRDRHHPCVILWGMGNESRSRTAYQTLRRVVRRLDPGRPVLYAENHLHRAARRRTLGIPDVWGCNYEIEALEQGAAASRTGSVVVTECANYPRARRGRLAEELKQTALLQRELGALANRGAAGFAVWSLNDYATLRKKRFLRYSGLVDAWRIPKISSAWLRALYLAEPFVKMYADWHAAGDAPVREVHIFTNCEKVSILRNGVKLLSLPGTPHAVCTVPFEPGELRAEGTGPRGAVCDRLLSYGPGKRLALEPARGEACSGDTVAFTVRVLDGEGRDVLSWEGDVRAEAHGPGRIRAYAPGGVIRVANGVGMGFVTGRGGSGVVRVRVAGAGLDPGEMHIPFG